MKKRTKRIRILILLLLIALAGAVKLIFFSEAPIQYITAQPDRGDVAEAVSASGTLSPVTVVSVGTQVSGIVTAVHADFNDNVKEGQLLAEIDQSPIIAQLAQTEASLRSAEASLRLAQSNYQRTKALFEHDFVPKADLERAETDLQSASSQVKITQGQVEQQKINLSYTQIKSPVAGIIISREIEVGQTVASSFQTPTLFKIAQDLRKMQIYSSMSEADINSAKPGMETRFSVDAFPDRKFTGIVRQVRLNPTVMQNVVTYNVVIDVDNADLALLPGMTAFLTLVSAEHKDVLRIPNSALSYRPSEVKKPQAGDRKEGMRTVYLLKNGAPAPVPVKTGLTDGKFTEITGGELKEGDPLITEEILPARKNANALPGTKPGGIGGRPPRF